MKQEAMRIWRTITDAMAAGLPLVAIEDENDAVAFATAAIASVSTGVCVELLRVTRPAELAPLEEAERVMSRARCRDVVYWTRCRKHVLNPSLSARDPGCVKTLLHGQDPYQTFKTDRFRMRSGFLIRSLLTVSKFCFVSTIGQN
jgi:hypothetical protein